ncbi:MAG TPA: DNA-processing protein DprA [Acidimicrobiales bacterium]|nr:DNA-processing protein DprA [Acidimicrobiales bacterium]
MSALPDAAYAAALACLPEVGPGWLASVIEGRSPRNVWEALGDPALAATLPTGRRGRSPDRLPGLSAAARSTDVASVWERCQASGVRVTWTGHPDHPAALAQGPAPCGVLFWRGMRPEVMRLPMVAVVGTRACTPAGSSVASEIAFRLVQAGVCVVSGLALGIDGAAHAGAVAAVREMGDEVGAGTVGVAASGVDVVYPRQHRKLWSDVQLAGAVVSETPPGRPAQAWRFPSRNRLIAGLSRLVVVVESHITGGSWHTVEAALRRGIDVGAVPGPVNSPSCAGTNKLLFDGAMVVRGAEDILSYLGLDGTALTAKASEVGGCAAPTPVVRRVHQAMGFLPMALDEIVERAGLPVAAVAVALDTLCAEGRVREQYGFWCRI